MLFLSRKQMESIFINENIVVTVLEIQGNKVRLGIEAPKEIPVHRMEVHARVAGPPIRPPPGSLRGDADTHSGPSAGEREPS